MVILNYCIKQNKIKKQTERFHKRLVDKITVHKRGHGCGVLWFGNFQKFRSVW